MFLCNIATMLLRSLILLLVPLCYSSCLAIETKHTPLNFTATSILFSIQSICSILEVIPILLVWLFRVPKFITPLQKTSFIIIFLINNKIKLLYDKYRIKFLTS